MSDEKAYGIPQWYAIYTHPRQEDRAVLNLEAWRVAVYSPKLKKRRRSQYGGSPTYLSQPLFPRYIFARFNSDELLSKVSFTRGVHSVVRFGDTPIPIDDEIIEIMRAREGADGFIKIDEGFKPGDRVIVEQGPFKNLKGIFKRPIKESCRVRILLDTISFQTHLSIEQGLIRKLDSAA